MGVEFSGRTRLTLERDSKSLRGAVGLNPDPGPFRTRLKPHETFDTPTIFVGAFSGGIDAMGNVLRPWVRQVLTNPRAWKNPNYPLLVNNSWGSGMAVDETLAKRMIRDSAELGLEMFHIDAGWFRGVGDWYPDPKKFPHGLAAIADDAHRHGLKFGIWVDWTQAALDTEPGALNVHDPKVHDWLVADLPPDWKPEEFKGHTIDIGVPAAHVLRSARSRTESSATTISTCWSTTAIWCAGLRARRSSARAARSGNHGASRTVERLSSRVRIPPTSAITRFAPTTTSTRNLRKQHPTCCSKSAMTAAAWWTSAAPLMATISRLPILTIRSRTGAHSTMRAMCFRRPCSKLMSRSGRRPRIENFRYMLRSGMMGWLTIMLDTNAWTEQQHAAAKEEFESIQGGAAAALSATQICITFGSVPMESTGTGRVL